MQLRLSGARQVTNDLVDEVSVRDQGPYFSGLFSERSNSNRNKPAKESKWNYEKHPINQKGRGKKGKKNRWHKKHKNVVVLTQSNQQSHETRRQNPGAGELCHCWAGVAAGGVKVGGLGCAPKELYLQRQVVAGFGLWAADGWLLVWTCSLHSRDCQTGRKSKT